MLKTYYVNSLLPNATQLASVLKRREKITEQIERASAAAAKLDPLRARLDRNLTQMARAERAYERTLRLKAQLEDTHTAEIDIRRPKRPPLAVRAAVMYFGLCALNTWEPTHWDAQRLKFKVGDDEDQFAKALEDAVALGWVEVHESGRLWFGPKEAEFRAFYEVCSGNSL